jgi:hypothetical protein
MQMLPKFVFQNTITYIHVASKHNQPTPLTNLVYTFEYDAIFVILQVQVVIPTKYTTTNFFVLK